MTARIINRDGVHEVSDRTFCETVFGHPPRTKAQREAEHRIRIERYIGFIENDNAWAVPPAYLAECLRIIELREGVQGDPFGPGSHPADGAELHRLRSPSFDPYRKGKAA